MILGAPSSALRERCRLEGIGISKCGSQYVVHQHDNTIVRVVRASVGGAGDTYT